MSIHDRFLELRRVLGARIVGQQLLIDRLLIALLADGHLLVEGAPGLAKTTAIKALGLHLEADFQRIQFTPDLLPADLTGTEIYRPNDHRFEFQSGPLFHNLVLADEVNRAPAKVQSALLEAMGERQITVGRVTYPLPKLFLVMATQNPIEQEGTYPLPEAQMDRFLLHVNIGYPDRAVEREILAIARRGEAADSTPSMAPIVQDEVFAARAACAQVHFAESLEQYLIELIHATREPVRYGDDLKRWVSFGASPRGSIALERCARAHAWLNGRDHVLPEDLHSIAVDALKHRIVLSFEAQAQGVTSARFIETLIERVPLP
jgi:MoxR-like ATPase